MLTRADTNINSGAQAEAGKRRGRSITASSAAILLVKLAKHLTVLACLAIVGQASGRAAIGQLGIFSLVVFAAALHSIGQTLARHEQKLVNFRRSGP